MIALTLIWLAAAVFAITATGWPRDRRRRRWLIVVAAILVVLAFAAQVFA